MSSVLIQQKARELHAKTRRQRMGTVTGPLVAAFFYVFAIKQFPNLGHLLHSLFALTLAWSVAGLYFLNRGNRSGALLEDAGFSTGLEFCRREIERGIDFFHRDLLWLFGPIILGMGTFVTALAVVAGPAIFSRAIPLISLMVLWIAAYLVIRVRQQRELRRELKDFSDIARENSR